MLKVSILVTRRADLTMEAFRAYWKEKHGPLFSSQPEVKLHVRKYAQEHTGPKAPDGFAVAPFDGIAEIWFENITVGAKRNLADRREFLRSRAVQSATTA